MPRKKQQTQQCVFQEGRRRCVRNGFGRPALCRAHLEVMREASTSDQGGYGSDAARVIGRVIRGQRVSNDDLAAGVVDILGAVLFRNVRPQPAAAGYTGGFPFPGMPQPQQAPPPFPGWMPPRQPRQPPPRQPPRPPPPPAVDNDARRVMGFRDGEVLTEEQIKDRKRELAKKHHPDRGGKLEVMQRINEAADRLMAELE